MARQWIFFWQNLAFLYFTVETSFLFTLSFFWTLHVTLEKLEGILRSFSCPNCGEYWRWAYDPMQSGVSKKICTALLLRCWASLLLWSSLSQFSPTGLLMCSSVTHPTACSSGNGVLFPSLILQQQLLRHLPLVGLLRVRMESPCSGLVWWAYCCVSKSILKAETEDT